MLIKQREKYENMKNKVDLGNEKNVRRFALITFDKVGFEICRTECILINSHKKKDFDNQI